MRTLKGFAMLIGAVAVSWVLMLAVLASFAWLFVWLLP